MGGSHSSPNERDVRNSTIMAGPWTPCWMRSGTAVVRSPLRSHDPLSDFARGHAECPPGDHVERKVRSDVDPTDTGRRRRPECDVPYRRAASCGQERKGSRDGRMAGREPQPRLRCASNPDAAEMLRWSTASDHGLDELDDAPHRGPRRQRLRCRRRICVCGAALRSRTPHRATRIASLATWGLTSPLAPRWRLETHAPRHARLGASSAARADAAKITSGAAIQAAVRTRIRDPRR